MEQSISELKADEELARFASVLCRLFDANPIAREVADEFARDIGWSIGWYPSHKLTELDQSIRRIILPSYLAGNCGRAKLPPGPLSTESLALISLHPDGYIRQAAVTRLAAIHDRKELRFLLLRANDWVNEVANSAHAALIERLIPEYADEWLKCTGLLTWLESRERRDNNALLECIRSYLQLPECRSALRSYMDSTFVFGRERRFLYTLRFECDSEDREALVSDILRSGDRRLNIWLAEWILASSDLGLVRYATPLLFGSVIPALRKIALQVAAERLPDSREKFLKAALLDCAASIRDEAVYRLRDSGLDLREFYVQAVNIEDGPRLIGALQGLGEHGDPVDSDLILPLLSNRLVRFRLEAIRALARLAGDDYIARLLHGLEDPSPKVSRGAAIALEGRLHLVAPDFLWQLITGRARGLVSRLRSRWRYPAHVRSNSLGLLARYSRWTALPFLVSASRLGHPLDLKAAVQIQIILGRSNRDFSVPTAVQIDRLESELKAATLLPQHLKSGVTDLIARFGTRF